MKWWIVKFQFLKRRKKIMEEKNRKLYVYKIEMVVSFEAKPNIKDRVGKNLAMDVVYGHDRKDFDRTKNKGWIMDFIDLELLENDEEEEEETV
jgi:hypothetical protein